jgi:hypothetical protein
MNAIGASCGVLYDVICAVPAASNAAGLIRLAQATGAARPRHRKHLMAERLVNADEMARLTGDRVRTNFRTHDEPCEPSQRGRLSSRTGDIQHGERVDGGHP